MRIHLGSDHAGFELKEHLRQVLASRDVLVVDHGPRSYQPEDDYPTYCLRVAEGVAADREAGEPSLGIVLGGSGNGEQLAANRVRGIRAALVWSEQTAQLARAHNDANVIAIGARMHTVEYASELVEIFLGTPFSADPRHQRRLAMLADYERDGVLPPLLGQR
ncbi:ribose-5-phosphate isomerase [Propionicimonas sp.]|uniref:ribose-5-phosphate isomerase n=1 Tax=Propionicimonas sp. TaxID=1955623 RepID=UPI0017B32B26|nr:ribose-5-phosphate isomerase [Propionicimonas sp.]MBU3975447.1 ribose-5-phosphate isomerase [Actinomycetota bacterium]MBA3020147.1 ribose-5-phosphate isomerase [Propionicimonas sp.]MBU3986404.1 ribose-5-phosphate isomerase [Actinomycetota bacterium]MBU4007973.1 ribose-5-phosphate isomerase [Actinomycetota bacterium]MBU4064231.1 ribose-5-phosphate isomerase [Actinomycetota bacterium]